MAFPPTGVQSQDEASPRRILLAGFSPTFAEGLRSALLANASRSEAAPASKGHTIHVEAVSEKASPSVRSRFDLVIEHALVASIASSQPLKKTRHVCLLETSASRQEFEALAVHILRHLGSTAPVTGGIPSIDDVVGGAQRLQETAAALSLDISADLEVVSGHLQLIGLPNTSAQHRQVSVEIALEHCEAALATAARLSDLDVTQPYVAVVGSPDKLVDEVLEQGAALFLANGTIEHQGAHSTSKIEVDRLQFRSVLISAIAYLQQSEGPGSHLFITHAVERSPTEASNNTSSGDYCAIRISTMDAMGRPTGIQPTRRSPVRGPLADLRMSLHVVRGHMQVHRDDNRITQIDLLFPRFIDETEVLARGTPQPSKQGRTVLVVDDEPMLVQLLQRFLNIAQVESLGHSAPLEALEWFAKNYHSVGLVIMDLKMAQMDGRECFQRMKEIDPSVRIAFLSGFIENEVEEDLLRRGALRFFQKPLRYPELVEWVKLTLDEE